LAFFANRPPLGSKEEDNPGHEKADKARRHGVEKHGIQAVVNHAIDRVTALLMSLDFRRPGT